MYPYDDVENMNFPVLKQHGRCLKILNIRTIPDNMHRFSQIPAKCTEVWDHKHRYYKKILIRIIQDESVVLVVPDK